MKELTPIISQKFRSEFFQGKLENFLTCRALATYLKENVLDEQRGAFLEKATLQAIFLSMLVMHECLSVSDAELLLSELPNILALNYPEVEQIRQAFTQILSELKDRIRISIDEPKKIKFYRNFNEFDNWLRMIQVFEKYKWKE